MGRGTPEQRWNTDGTKNGEKNSDIESHIALWGNPGGSNSVRIAFIFENLPANGAQFNLKILSSVIPLAQNETSKNYGEIGGKTDNCGAANKHGIDTPAGIAFFSRVALIRTWV